MAFSFSVRAVVELPARALRLVRPDGSWWPGGRLPGGDRDTVLQPDDVRDKVRVQVGVIREAYGDEVAVHTATGDDGDAEFFYHPSRLLVRTRDLQLVARLFKSDRRYDGTGEGREAGLPGLSYYVPPRRRDRPDLDVLTSVVDLERAAGRRIATPDHLLCLMSRGYGSVCPAEEPGLPTSMAPVPPVSDDADAGKGVRVSVVDTGWWPRAQAHPWLEDVDADPTDIETVDPKKIHPYAGHGTFVAGVVRCVAPAAEVEVEGFLPRGGAVYESEIVEQLHEAVVDPDGPDLISISAGGRTHRAQQMLAFVVLREAARRGLKQRRGRPVLIVAAAGNDGADWPLYPAAFDWVLSVGSLDEDGTVSDFSNYGDWVDVYARGRDLVNAFPVGTYTCYEPEHAGEVRDFDGLARWSGTSFSTPVVTGTLAASMSRGMSVHAAKAALIADGVPMTAPDGSAAFAVASF